MVAANQTVVAWDIAGFGSRPRTTSSAQALLAGMHESVEYAFSRQGISRNGWFQRESGDGGLVLAPPEVEKGTFAGSFLTDWAAALDNHNALHPEAEQVNLRLALHAGEISSGDHGPIGPALIHASRLLEAQPLRDVLAKWGPLAVIVSNWFYYEVIWQSPEYEAEAYRRVTVEVKETHDFGWIRAPGHELPIELP